MFDQQSSRAQTFPGRESPASSSRSGAIVGGLAVIAIGLVFLASNLGFDLPFLHWRNGWALIILIGAVPSLGRALDRYRSVGTVDGEVLRCVLRAVMVVTVAVIVLLDASFTVWWPLFLILGGLSILAGGGRRYRGDWVAER